MTSGYLILQLEKNIVTIRHFQCIINISNLQLKHDKLLNITILKVVMFANRKLITVILGFLDNIYKSVTNITN